LGPQAEYPEVMKKFKECKQVEESPYSLNSIDVTNWPDLVQGVDKVSKELICVD
jgi:hypothetical protein